MTETPLAASRAATDEFQADDLHVVRPRAAGLDVHKMAITATVRLCEPGQGLPRMATREFSALPKGLRELTAWLCEHGVTAAAMEGTGIYWLAPYEALEEAGIEPELFHAQHVKQIKGRKTDYNDSVWLARICQFGLALPSYVPPRPFRELRPLSRYRRKLAGERSRARNRIHKALDQDGLRLGGALSDILGMNGRRILDGLLAGRSKDRILASLSGHVRRKRELLEEVLEAGLRPHSVWRLRDLLRAHDAAQASIDELDARLTASLRPYEAQLQLLETVPGIDRGSACAILVELGPDLRAFRKPSHVPAWAGVAPGNDKSAGKQRSRRSRQGNRTLKSTLAECATGAARTKGTQFQGFHKALAGRIGYKRAIIATAHKMLRVIQAMLRDGEPYRDPGFDYERLVVERNAPRWLRKLKQYGYLDEAAVSAATP